MKINLKAFSIAILHDRIYRPYYLDPETGDLFSSLCLDAKTLKSCNVSDLNPKTGTVRTALCLCPQTGRNMIAVFGENTLKIYEDAGYIKMDIPFCSQAYLCQTFLRSRFPDKQEREAVCREYGIDDSYDFKFVYSDDEYDEAMKKRNNAYADAARECFRNTPLADKYYNAYMLYESFEEQACLAYAMLWSLENGYMSSDKTLYAPA